jgi:hypothetical protein
MYSRSRVERLSYGALGIEVDKSRELYALLPTNKPVVWVLCN